MGLAAPTAPRYPHAVEVPLNTSSIVAATEGRKFGTAARGGACYRRGGDITIQEMPESRRSLSGRRGTRTSTEKRIGVLLAMNGPHYTGARKPPVTGQFGGNALAM